jgi:hypothetical protein
MKKKELVQRVMDDAGLQFGDRTTAMVISSVFNSIVGQLFNKDPNQFMFYTKRITLTVNNRVSTLTVPIIQTRVNGSGIPQIMPTGADNDCCPDGTVFYPMPSYALRSKSDVNNLSNIVFYTVTGSKVRFNNSLPKDVTSLLADVVMEFHGYDDDDFFNLPSGVAQLIIDQSVAAIKAKQAHVNIYKPKE